MQRMTALVLLAMACLVLAATPAVAQRDPFTPLIDPDAASVGTTDTTTTNGSTDTTTVDPNVGSDSLANTGTDISPWLAVAYSLLVLGGATLLIARMYQPLPVHRR